MPLGRWQCRQNHGSTAAVFGVSQRQGQVHFRAGEWESALDSYTKALDITAAAGVEAGSPESALVAAAYSNRAAACLKFQRYEQVGADRRCRGSTRSWAGPATAVAGLCPAPNSQTWYRAAGAPLAPPQVVHDTGRCLQLIIAQGTSDAGVLVPQQHRDLSLKAWARRGQALRALGNWAAAQLALRRGAAANQGLKREAVLLCRAMSHPVPFGALGLPAAPAPRVSAAVEQARSLLLGCVRIQPPPTAAGASSAAPTCRVGAPPPPPPGHLTHPPPLRLAARGPRA